MRRRVFASLALYAVATRAQVAGPRRLVAYLNSGSSGSFASGNVVMDELARLGWKDGATLQYEARYADNRQDRLGALARELVALNPAVIVAASTEATLALKRLTDHIPIVMANGTDPVANGLAVSLARPGGNVTGVVTMGLDIVPKLVEYASTVSPRAHRLGVLLNTANPNNARALDALRKAAAVRGMEVVPYLVHSADEIDQAVRAMQPAADHVLVVGLDALILQHLERIAMLARAARLPSVSLAVAWAAGGGLLSYGPEWRDNFKRAAQLADQILRGSRAAEMPIEQPTRVHLILNLRTAREIGIQLPRELLLRADEVIQ